MMRWLAVAAVLASGCALLDGLSGESDDGNGGLIDPPPGSPDAAMPPPGPLARDLGRGCIFAQNNCPPGLNCQAFSDVGSQIEGYCSPMCNPADPFDPVCTDGFPGPGDPFCGDVGNGTGVCIITCDQSMACPIDLSCTFIPDPKMAGNDGFVCLGDG